jgi:hypothetical protein
LGCLWLAFSSAVDPAWGVTYLLMQAMAVFVLAGALEWMSWRQLAPTRHLPFAA